MFQNLELLKLRQNPCTASFSWDTLQVKQQKHCKLMFPLIRRLSTQEQVNGYQRIVKTSGQADNENIINAMSSIPYRRRESSTFGPICPIDNGLDKR